VGHIVISIVEFTVPVQATPYQTKIVMRNLKRPPSQSLATVNTTPNCPATYFSTSVPPPNRELSEILGRKADLNTPGFLSKYYRDKVLAEAVVHYDAA